MARDNITPEQWSEARIIWESDDKITFADVAKMLGVSKQAVAKRAGKTPQWQRRMDAQNVAKRAYAQADRTLLSDTLPLARNFPEPSIQGIDVVGADKKITAGEKSGSRHVEAEEVDTTGMTIEERAEAAAVKKRAEIIARHRQEALSARVNIYASMKDKNFELGKVAKINSEALQIVQNMERKAWGLDVQPDGGTVVVIDRS